MCGSFRCIENRPGSMGKPAPGYNLKVGISEHFVTSEAWSEFFSELSAQLSLYITQSVPGTKSCITTRPRVNQGHYYNP